jgi:hypothetical protein
MPYERMDWREQCIASLAGQGCNIHVFDGFEHDIGKTRKHGFALGNAEFVTFADPDDWVEPGAIARCVAVLDSAPSAVMAWTSENYVDAEGRFKCVQPAPSIHHLQVYRRSWLIDTMMGISLSATTPEPQLIDLARSNAIFTGTIGYNWRHHAEYDKGWRGF